MAINTINLETQLQTQVDAVDSNTKVTDMFLLVKSNEALVGQIQLSDISLAGSAQTSNIVNAGAAQIVSIEAAGDDELQQIASSGDTELAEITQLADTKIGEYQSLAELSTNSLTDLKNGYITEIQTEKDTALTAIGSQETSAVNAINTNKDDALLAIATASGDEQLSIGSVGTTQVSNVNAAGATKISEINSAGQQNVADVEAVVGTLNDNQLFYNTVSIDNESPEYYWRVNTNSAADYDLILVYENSQIYSLNTSDSAVLTQETITVDGIEYFRGVSLGVDGSTEDFSIAKDGTSPLEVIFSISNEINVVGGLQTEIEVITANIDVINNTAGQLDKISSQGKIFFLTSR